MMVVLDNAEAAFVRELLFTNPEAESVAIEWLPRTNRVSVVIDEVAFMFDPEEVEAGV